MKNIIALLAWFAGLQVAKAQDNPHGLFLSPAGKKQSFCVELNGESGKVYRLGSWLDIAGRGYSITHEDTILKQPAGSEWLFAGKKTGIRRVGNQWQLVWLDKKKNKPIAIDTSADQSLINRNLNNAYWLDHFFQLSREINAQFKPYYYYSFRKGFADWNALKNKDIYHLEFRLYTDSRLKWIKDSITALQSANVSLINQVNSNISIIGYTPLKDSIARLAGEYPLSNTYLSSIINSVCRHRPELYFKLVEDMPGQKEMLFAAVTDKEGINNLKATNSHPGLKKDFFDQRKEDKSFTTKMILTAAAGAALLGVILFALF